MKKKVLFLVNHDVVIYNFRKEIVEELLEKGYEVIISSPYGERIDELVSMGCKYIAIEFDRHNTNALRELKLLSHYVNLIKNLRPEVILGFTIKPNIYGAIAARLFNIPFIANITGLGSAVENKGILQLISIFLYKISFYKIDTVFFQNTENEEFFVRNKIALGKHKMLPGSGVNLEKFFVQDYPETDYLDFVFISRIMKEKGIDQYLEAASFIKEKYSNIRFHVCGFCEEDYKDILFDYEQKGTIIYHGMVKDIRKILKEIHCTIHPTYYPEGLSNVLLESAASGRPLITTNRSGTREVVDNGVNGYLVKSKDSQDLSEKIERFIGLSNFERKQMGLAGRKKVEREFDRRIVVDKYLSEIERITSE